jgi:putative transposase
MRSFKHRQWHLDEVFVKINGVKHYLWRAVDHEGEVLESFVTKRRDKKAALSFLRKLLKRHGQTEMIVTDRLASYGAEKGRCDSKAQDRPVVEQPHRELSPAISTTGASDTPVQANEKPAETRRSPWPGPQPLRFAALRVSQERTLISRRNFAPRTFGSKDRRSAALTAWRQLFAA